MAEPQFADHHDDLPRTFRREREAREREAREREAREVEAHQAALAAAQVHHDSRVAQAYQQPAPQFRGGDPAADFGAPEPMPAFAAPEAVPVYGGAMANGTVTRFEVPFLHLVLFFLKAVIAAIPALILLTMMLWAGGQGLKAFFPALRHFEIVIKSSETGGEANVPALKPAETPKAAPTKR